MNLIVYTFSFLLLLLSNPWPAFGQFSGGTGDGDVVGSVDDIPMSNFWRGTTSTAWNTAANWGRNAVPASGEDIVFASDAVNNLVADNAKITNDVNFNGSDKNLVLGNFNVTVNGSILGAGSGSYFRTNGSGALIKNIASGSTFGFPVGNSAYNPVSITNNTGSDDVFSLRVSDLVQYNVTWGYVATEPHVQRTWFITKTNPNSGSGVDFVFNWNSGEETPGITTHKLYHHNGNAWQKQTGSTSVSGNSLTYTGYTGTFSPFAIGDDIILLPVTWLDFQCDAPEEKSIRLLWRTAMEQNTRRFFAERSAEGHTYETIGEIPAAGNSYTGHSYSFTDRQPLPSGGYYRVRVEDQQGSFSYSEVCKSTNKTVVNPATLKVFPNPSKGEVFMLAAEPAIYYVWEVFSPTGQCVAAGNSKDGQANARLHHLSDGVYQLRVMGSGLSENHKILIRH